MRAIDHASFAGKTPMPSQHVTLLVVGAGRSGVAAACHAAQEGTATMLVEEQPVPESMMRLDVPHYFGQRLLGAQSGPQMMEQILASDPALAGAYELGIDVQLGVCAWAIFKLAAGSTPTARFLVGLADGRRSWFVACDRLIVATGSRDVCLAFPGWEKPGVMGALAALQLMQRYDAFNGTRMVVLGAGPLAQRVAEAAAQKGVAVECLVDIEESPGGLHIAAQASGTMETPLFRGYVIQSAGGGAEVEFAQLVRIDAQGKKPVEGTEVRIPCDTIVLALGAVPNIELLDSLGCRTDFQGDRGGWVPQLDDGMTSVPFASAVGSCAGVDGDPGVPQLRRWLRAQVAASGLDVVTCQCEEVTRRELLGLKPPRYVTGVAPTCARDLAALGADGPLNQDQVKRLTRAGMGACQGRRCREQIQVIIEDVTGAAPGSVPLARYRPPVRPLPLSLLAADDEPAALKDHWVAWFNISTQWLAHWEPSPVPLPSPGIETAIGDGE